MPELIIINGTTSSYTEITEAEEKSIAHWLITKEWEDFTKQERETER